MLSDRCLSVCISDCLSVSVLWPNGCTDQGDIVLNGGQLPQRDTTPNFRPISVVAKQLDGLRCHMVWK